MIRYVVGGQFLACALVVSRLASAQANGAASSPAASPPPAALPPTADPPPAAPPAADPPYVASSYVTPTDVSPNRVPATRIGFQMAIRTGYSVPFGKALDAPKGDMSDNFSGQVPIFVEVGGKPIANLFVGGYFGLNIGGVAGSTQKTCDTLRATCVAVGVRIGAEIQYHFLPDRAVNPWIGYGIGYEVAAQGISATGHDETDSLTGFEFARLSSGVDFRMTKTFGIGPFVDFSAGTYTDAQIKINGDSARGTIDKTAGHQWLTLGVRFVFFP